MNNNFPNLLIVGSAKAATTTIHEYLKQHTDVFMSEPKEPSFFTFAGEGNVKFSNGNPLFVTNKEKYLKLFSNGKGRKVIGESSTPYLYFFDKTIKNIKKIHPSPEDIKIIIVLRNPSERAYSQYMMEVRDLLEDKPFYEALNLEEERKKNNEHFDLFYLDRGLYYNQVKAYLENFKHTKILFYEDFIDKPVEVLNDILDFLKLEKMDFDILPRYNVSGVSKSKVLTKIVREDLFIKKILRIFLTKEMRKKWKNEIMSHNVKKEDRFDIKSKEFLKNFYKSDIKNLEMLLNRDLTNWIK